MTIQFQCTSCGQEVNTPDQMAGKNGKCPHCQAIVQIPAALPPDTPVSGGLKVLDEIPTRPAPLKPLPTLDPLAAVPTDNPFDDIPAQNFGGPAPNPYQSPGMANPQQGYPQQGYRPASIHSQMMGPAIGMIVVAGLTLLVGIVNLLRWLVVGAHFGIAWRFLPFREHATFIFILAIALIIVQLTIHTIVLIGGIKILLRSNYRLAMTACILAIFPCAFFFVLGMPFGIWGLVVLMNPEAKRAFNN